MMCVLLESSALEKRLETVGQRWTDICQQVEEHMAIFDEILARWHQFETEQMHLSDWLTGNEGTLTQVKIGDRADLKVALEHVKVLKVSAGASSILSFC